MKSSFAIIASVYALGQSLCAAQVEFIQPAFSADRTQFARIDPSTIKGLEGGKFNGPPDENAKEFEELWSNTGFTSLSQLLDTKLSTCVDVNDETPRTNVTGVTEITLTGINIPGPMSFDLNGVQIFHTNNVRKDYPASQNGFYKIPVDLTSCQESCLPISRSMIIVPGVPPSSPPVAPQAPATSVGFNSAPSSSHPGTVTPGRM
ncbi:hypothetical protein PsorP6_014151 [Peronosclerospora sorghi]|uniref:Uncharacterized protein n=1 Tax=Peronosclerospora sorghi TaxID=230839 RepID=A0ACC0VIU0_9STRA|nr:hypothetical protein PsorP6_014151 [Peronosclerospora sorghi]